MAVDGFQDVIMLPSTTITLKYNQQTEFTLSPRKPTRGINETLLNTFTAMELDLLQTNYDRHP